MLEILDEGEGARPPAPPEMTAWPHLPGSPRLLFSNSVCFYSMQSALARFSGHKPHQPTEPALVKAAWSSLAQTGRHLINYMAPIHGLVASRLSAVSHSAGTHCSEYSQELPSCSSLMMQRRGDYYYCYQVARREQEVGALVGSQAQDLNTGPAGPGSPTTPGSPSFLPTTSQETLSSVYYLRAPRWESLWDKFLQEEPLGRLERTFNTTAGKFPGGPVVRTTCFYYREHGFYPWSGN